MGEILDTGYEDETFDLVWRRQDADSNIEELIPLYWNSTATLHEMGMPAEPQRCYLLIKEKADGTQPKRVEKETEQPTGQQTKKVREMESAVACFDGWLLSLACVCMLRERERVRGRVYVCVEG